MALQSFRHQGIAYPFQGTARDLFTAKSDTDVFSSSIRNIILTPLGRQPYDPTHGSFVPLLIGEQKTGVMKALLAYYVRSDLTRQEPRIVVLDVIVQDDPANTNGLLVTVSYRPRDQAATAVNSVEIGL